MHYTITLSDDSGCDEEMKIEAATDDEARAGVADIAAVWCAAGEWDDDGDSAEVSWSLCGPGGTHIDHGDITVEIEPDHEALIADAAMLLDDADESCGNDPDDHEWTTGQASAWLVGGTGMSFHSHCRKCGLHCTEHRTGWQRNPGDHDTAEYEFFPASV